MKSKRLCAAALILSILGGLTGCQLAKEDGTANAEKDRFIGVYITTEHLDLFDMESYLEDNLNTIMKGGNTVVNADDSVKYQNRLYAVLEDEALTNESTGEISRRQRFVFTDVEGFGYYAPLMYESETESSYISSEVDEGISDGHTHVSSGDEEERIELTGTVYVCPDFGESVEIYCNPVYQTTDGRVYLQAGNGMSFSNNGGEGVNMSTKREETVTLTEDGKEKSYTTIVEIAVETVYTPEKIVVLQMDAAGLLLDSQEYIPGQLPDEIEPLQGTEYLIVETHKTDSAGEETVFRELIDQEETGFETLYAKENGICVEDYTRVLWEK